MRSPALGCGARGPAGEDHHCQCGEPEERATGDIERKVHSAVHPRQAHEERESRPRRTSATARKAGLSKPRGEEQDEAPVHRDRRGGVAGRIARIHGKVLEPRHARTVLVECERRGPVSRGLDDQREHDESRDPPFSEARRAGSRSRRRRSEARPRRRRSSRSGRPRSGRAFDAPRAIRQNADRRPRRPRGGPRRRRLRSRLQSTGRDQQVPQDQRGEEDDCGMPA